MSVAATTLPPPSYYEDYTTAPSPPAYDAPTAAAVGSASSSSSSVISFTLNGSTVTADFGNDPTLTPSSRLSDFIRFKTPYTGTKVYCHEGGCGACVVNLTYTDPTTNAATTVPINSCLRPLLSCNGLTVTTNDGIGTPAQPHAIQSALAAHNGSQCGYCSNGMVMSMHALLSQNPSLTQLDIENYFDGNLCRCTGYRPILDAMKTFANSNGDKKSEGHEHCGEDDCRKTGCKRKMKTLPEMEDLSTFIPATEPYTHKSKPKLHKATRASTVGRISVAANGAVWQDCPTLADLNVWLPWYVSQGNKPMLVVAQTSLGVYPTEPAVRLNIAQIPELYQVTQNASGITIGASTTIANVIQILTSTTADQTFQTAHFSQAANHLGRIASNPIRAVASMFGNIALAIQNQSATNFFTGDGLTVFYGLGVTFNMYDTVAQQALTAVTMDQLINMDFTGKYCKSFTIPWGLENEFFMSYKIAMRQVNAHAYVNAAMRVVVNPNTQLIEGAPVIVYGGINPVATRYSAIEQGLIGHNITDNTQFQTTATALDHALTPTEFLGKQDFRKATAVNFFYKFFLYLQGSTLPANLQTGAACWMSRTVSQGTQTWQPNPAEYPVSAGFPKVEALQQTTGHAKYTADLTTPMNTLFASLVLGQQANCEIATVDFTAAAAMDGFYAFYQASDLGPNQNSWQNGEIFSSGSLQWWGQCIGVVLATTERFADECAAAVVVTYKNIATPVVTLQQAIAANSFMPTAQVPPPVTRGNATTAMASAAKVITGTVELGYQYHFHMENHVTLVVPREDVLEVHSATQMPVPLQQQCAAVSGYPMSKVVVTVKRCGGGFGGKISSSVLPAAIATICAVKTMRPVQIVVDLQKTTALLGCRGGKLMTYTVGVTNDGLIQALEANVVCSGGAVITDAVGADMVAIHSLDNAYYIPNANIVGQLVTMNIAPVTAVRGPGWVPGIHFGESIISSIASSLGVDPNTIREKNFFTKGQTTCDGMILSYWDMPAIWSTLKENAGYATRVSDVEAYNNANRWTKRGLAMTAVRFGVGQTGANFDCLVNIYPDGTVSITHGGSEIGQGINTKVIQVAALKFGMTLAEIGNISINETCTRSISAGSNVTGGSVTSELCSLAVMHACETLNRRLAPFRTKGQTWLQLITAAGAAGVELSSSGFTNAPVNGSGIFNYNSNGAALSEVEVDILTGQYQVRRVDIVFDCGVSLNPMIDVGQVEGGFLFGQGYYTQEDPSWDPATGQPMAGSTWEYKPPSAYDVPETFNIALLKNAPNPLGVLGSKATGEPGVALATSVVQALESAITAARSANGLGSTRWLATSLPLTVNKIQQACGTTVTNLEL
ncbi:xanthine dehydrogenase oxidase-like, putative [Bodo saltans]|uniref:Xanthine dehydrogenase oxidase-like, putative n=1 Tax=Bodo saltans TaxID=75058 RepID=A0A0S4IH69_BODSA|nr:xanthine dehydrogenase oxidase-like, putative [Bodo saltans]|eukprot:CUE58771.1 xanthine dehydrogenase oxidase-like, putative [Bodo saltans]